ncbi:glycoside hydrolase family 32 protein [Candidatus Sumerlaeota bacterium]|nr:glycoside hydrolase family 32 protein [Candidatus Sumerlaeota bacterium]
MKIKTAALLLSGFIIPFCFGARAAPDKEEDAFMERYRPQFHFTAKKNWLNDPNGCVFYDGEYHLFFQRNPKGNEWGNMTWGHAVSKDLVRWNHLPDAIAPYGGGDIFSGTAVVDQGNTSGLGKGSLKPIIAFFTHTTQPSVQAMAYSNDRGRTWNLYEGGKAVVPNQGLDICERDPKVFRHEPSGKWVMALWVKNDILRFFTSDDLKNWDHASDFEAPGFYECPDIFEARVDNNPNDRRWVAYDAGFNYWIGSFDGKSFKAQTGPFRGDVGNNFYAAQTWNNTPCRIIQIAWMRGGIYPGMPFNQQMSFPCELTLCATSSGVRLRRLPVKEIEALYDKTFTWKDEAIEPGKNILREISGELFDIELTIEPGGCSEFGLMLHDCVISWREGKLSCMGVTADLPDVAGKVELRALVDRTTIEIFGNRGAVSMSNCFLPKELSTGLELYVKTGGALIHSMTVHILRSAFEKGETSP